MHLQSSLYLFPVFSPELHQADKSLLNAVEKEHHTVKETYDFHLEQYLLDKEITPDSTVQDIMVHVMKREQKIYAFYAHHCPDSLRDGVEVLEIDYNG